MTLTHGGDISHYQGEHGADIEQIVAEWAWAFIGIKATQGTSFIDPAFVHNWDLAGKLKLTRLAYDYAEVVESATAAALHFLAVVKPVPEDVLVLDLERGTTKGATNAWARVWARVVRNEVPFDIRIGVYMGHDYIGSATGAGLADVFDFLWYPRYPSSSSTTRWPSEFDPVMGTNLSGFAAPEIWQWTQVFDGKYDADVSTLTALALRTPGGLMADQTAIDVLDSLIPYPDPNLPGKEATLASHIGWMNYHTTTTLALVGAMGKTILAQQAQLNAQGAQLTALQASVDGLPADLTAAIAAAVVNVQINGIPEATS